MSNYTVIGEQSSKPMVSVAMLTYNHQEYIKEAIESVLMQQTNFFIQLVIAEDCSTDGTREIVLDYQRKNPKKIKLILQHQNVGASLNNLDLFKNIDGKYIAALEGDDYWTGPYKLQKQVDFIENNPNFSIIFHQIQVLENDILTQEIYPLTEKVKNISTIEDLSKHNYIPTLSVLFKNQFNYPSYIQESFIGDYPLHLYNAEKGKIKFISEVMGVYRKGVGVWSSENNLIRSKKMLESLFLIGEYYKNNRVVHSNLIKQQNFYFYVYLKGNIADNQSVFSFVFKNDLFKNSTLKTKLYVIIKFLLNK